MGVLRLDVNGKRHEVEADPAAPLVYVLRNVLGLTAAKLGCALEQCGACAVLVDGESTLTCMEPAARFEGRAIRTVEGLADDPSTRAVLDAFVAAGAAQCGYCIPGIVVAVSALLAHDPHPDDAAVRAALEPHLCRCGTHPRVLSAVRKLASGAGS